MKGSIRAEQPRQFYVGIGAMLVLVFTLMICLLVFFILQVNTNKSSSAAQRALAEDVQTIEQEVVDLQSNATAHDASNQAAQQHAQMQIDQLRSEVVELQMASANVTVLQSGTYIWTFGSSYTSSDPSISCTWFITGWQIANAGINYVVGDLISISVAGIFNPQIFASPVFRVDTVDGNGAVLTFDTLTVGCATGSYGVTQGPFNMLTLRGSGLTMEFFSSTPVAPLNNAYYNFPTPMSQNCAALQEATYQLKSLTIESVEFTILELNPPPFPVQLDSVSGGINNFAMAAYAFEPDILQLRTLGSYPYVFPLTTYNKAAFSFTDSTNCLAGNTCYYEPWRQPNQQAQTGIIFQEISHFGLTTPYDIHDEWIATYWHSVSGLLNFQGANFTLNYPMMLVLPSL